MALDDVRVVREREQPCDLLRALREETGAADNLTTDACLAALAIGHGAILACCDNDFMRFEGLRWENPLGHSTQ